MRLIDADKFKEFLTKLYEEGAPYDGIIELLDKEPTAYDVDKVVEELEEIKVIGTYPYDVVKEAIEIVKGGGIDGR